MMSLPILPTLSFFYPLAMGLLWMLGAIIFFWRWERGQQCAVPELEDYPLFSILVPAHNEVAQLEATIAQLTTLNYPDYEIIVADDGSTDGTTELLHQLCGRHARLRAVYLERNGGKARALNAAFAVARGDYLLVIDADARLDVHALRWMAWHFNRFPRVGAVTGNPRVLNRTTLLAKIQTGEFAAVVGLIKRAQRVFVGKILTVSGVIAAFRREALIDAGLWDPHMATDDIDITWSLQRRFWDVRYEPRAIVWMLVPETVRGLWQQRLRWAVGGIEVLQKNADIWRDWRQHRLYPLYLEYACSVLWAVLLWLVVAMRILQFGMFLFLGVTFGRGLNPTWIGALLALMCILMFLVALMLDRTYEKHMVRYLLWVIWYPIAYWLINASVVVVALAKVMLRPRGQGVWTSPDRGIRQAGNDG